MLNIRDNPVLLSCTRNSPSEGWHGVPGSSQVLSSEAIILVGLYCKTVGFAVLVGM